MVNMRKLKLPQDWCELSSVAAMETSCRLNLSHCLAEKWEKKKKEKEEEKELLRKE